MSQLRKHSTFIYLLGETNSAAQKRALLKTITPGQFQALTLVYNIGDWVRISYLKRTFDREYDEKWTREFFKVVKREYMQGKQLYTLEDYAGDPVEGRFYREELQPVTVTGDEIYKIEKVIKTIKKRGQPTQYLVRWLGWGPKFDSYIDEAVLKNIRGGEVAK